MKQPIGFERFRIVKNRFLGIILFRYEQTAQSVVRELAKTHSNTCSFVIFTPY